MTMTYKHFFCQLKPTNKAHMSSSQPIWKEAYKRGVIGAYNNQTCKDPPKTVQQEMEDDVCAKLCFQYPYICLYLKSKKVRIRDLRTLKTVYSADCSQFISKTIKVTSISLSSFSPRFVALSLSTGLAIILDAATNDIVFRYEVDSSEYDLEIVNIHRGYLSIFFASRNHHEVNIRSKPFTWIIFKQTNEFEWTLFYKREFDPTWRLNKGAQPLAILDLDSTSFVVIIHVWNVTFKVEHGRVIWPGYIVSQSGVSEREYLRITATLWALTLSQSRQEIYTCDRRAEEFKYCVHKLTVPSTTRTSVSTKKMNEFPDLVLERFGRPGLALMTYTNTESGNSEIVLVDMRRIRSSRRIRNSSRRISDNKISNIRAVVMVTPGRIVIMFEPAEEALCYVMLQL
jgi:hypothetical protein